MRLIRHFSALLALLLLAACDSDGLAPRALVGEWSRQEESGTGTSWNSTELRLQLRADGSYTWGSTAHADWGRPGDKLLGYSREHGRFDVEGDSLFLQPARRETWDYLTGGPFEEDLSDFAAARFRVRIVNRDLVLSYISYPLDAPEETRLVLRRD